MLTHSFSGKALAVKRVTENQGKKTPGVDGITWSSPETKFQAVTSLKRHGYRPLPLRRIYIPKSNGKMRPLGIPTMKDRAMQALHLLALEPVAETMADKNSYGFRPARSTADAYAQCHCLLAKKLSARWILEGDIKGCFDNINYEWMIEHVPMDTVILCKWLKAGYVEGNALYLTEAGTPQGGIISPTLANMALDGLEPMILQRYLKENWNKQKVNIVRYADDFIITGATKEVLENEVRPMVEEFLAKRGLMLSPEKTKITHIDEGFDFLGFNIRKYGGKLLIKPSKKNVSAFLGKVRDFIKGNKSLRQDKLIRALNPVVKGWANYHKHAVASDTFHRVRMEIWRCLWQWAKRRHPHKSRTWIKEKYFHTMNGRSWVFAADTGERLANGKPKLVKLWDVGDTKIRRHCKIKANANPFDPKWEIYFEQRYGLNTLDTLKGRRKLIRLWMDQEERCPVCSERITATTGWHVHHIVRRVDGGSSNVSNLVMVHPYCHRQVHARGLIVEKPVPAREL
jgi:RNA-directed DNA polymerase